MQFPLVPSAILMVALFFAPPAGAEGEKEVAAPAGAEGQKQREGAAASGAATSATATAPSAAEAGSGGAQGPIVRQDEPLPVGEEILVPGGWIRIEEGEVEMKGTYNVVPSSSYLYDDAAREDRQEAKQQRADPRARRGEAKQGPGKRGPRCAKEKEGYLRELFRIAGIQDIDLPFPLELIEALEETPGVLNLAPSLPLAWAGVPVAGGIGVDPIRALAWDEGLRWAAEDLVRCHHSSSR